MNKAIAFVYLLFNLLNIGFGEPRDYKGIAKDRKLLVSDTVINPVIPGDFADPSVIRVGNTYYAAGTSSEWAPHYPLYTSTDLVHWKSLGYVFPETPDWASSSFWAPELFYRNGLYYVYYTARKKSDNISCIGVATSKDPAKGFVDRGIVVDFGKEAIDAFITEADKKLYLSFKAYGLDDRPIELLCYELAEDGLKTVGEPFMLLRDDQRQGLEGQCVIKRNNYYYLLYSAGGCCGSKCSYHVNIARAASFKGPYEKYDSNPVLDGQAEWKCTGHGTIVQTAKGVDHYLYHAYSKDNDVYTGRQGMLAKLNWDKKTGWPGFEVISGENVGGFKDDFSSARLNENWQWDFRNTTPEIRIEKGWLHLSGKTTADNISGTIVTVRPAKPNYQITTSVVNHNAALKGLAVYGDANQSVGIGIANDTVKVWSVQNNTLRLLNTVTVKSKAPIQLKLVAENGYQLKFYWSDVAGKWNQLPTGDTYFNADFLPPWDRSPRPGLIQSGTEPAVFDFFEISY